MMTKTSAMCTPGGQGWVKATLMINPSTYDPLVPSRILDSARFVPKHLTFPRSFTNPVLMSRSAGKALLAHHSWLAVGVITEY